MGKSFNNLHALADGMEARAAQLLDAYQGYGVSAAVQLAPIDDGDLRNSGGPAPGDGPHSRRVVFTAAHAPHQEYGTMHMQAQPYLRPAFSALRDPFKRDAKSVFKA